MRIDKDILFGLLAARMRDETALWLTRLLVYHDCTENHVLRGPAAVLQRLPPHKTLFRAEPNKGLPIGAKKCLSAFCFSLKTRQDSCRQPAKLIVTEQAALLRA